MEYDEAKKIIEAFDNLCCQKLDKYCDPEELEILEKIGGLAYQYVDLFK